MKSTNFNTISKSLFTGILATCMLFGFNSCAKKSTAAKSTANNESAAPMIMPEDKGQLLVKRDANSNYVIQINISDLEAVKKMQPAKEGYVVWVVTESNGTKNLGQIEGANSWLSKKDKASFEATTPFKPTKVFITAENDLTIQKPGTQIVWSTNKF